MAMARTSPTHATAQKRSRFLPCSGFPKLQIVLIKYENIVATTKATPFAIDGAGNTSWMKAAATSTCSPVASNPEIPKRSACLVTSGATALAFIGCLEDAKQRDAKWKVEAPE